jgi:hypothetical protein
MKRALVCSAGGFIGGHPENFGLRIADCGFRIANLRIWGAVPGLYFPKSQIRNPK